MCARVPTTHQLRALELGDTGLGMAAATALGGAIHYNLHLVSLDLSDNRGLGNLAARFLLRAARVKATHANGLEARGRRSEGGARVVGDNDDGVGARRAEGESEHRRERRPNETKPLGRHRRRTAPRENASSGARTAPPLGCRCLRSSTLKGRVTTDGEPRTRSRNPNTDPDPEPKHDRPEPGTRPASIMPAGGDPLARALRRLGRVRDARGVCVARREALAAPLSCAEWPRPARAWAVTVVVVAPRRDPHTRGPHAFTLTRPSSPGAER